MTIVTKREELPDLLFRRYRPLAKIVTAVQLTEAVDLAHPFAAHDTFHGKPGDWKITYGTDASGKDDVAIVEKDVFSIRYEHVEGDRYRKKSSVVIEAAQLENPLNIVTLEGPSHGEPGDWLLIGAEDDPYFNSNAYFSSRYVPAE